MGSPICCLKTCIGFNETNLDKRKAAIVAPVSGFVFGDTSAIQENFGVGRVSWESGPPGGAAIAEGIDVLAWRAAMKARCRA
jgi:hypothetical protein